MTHDLDADVPYYIKYVGERWGEDVYDRPGNFTVYAAEGLRVLKRHFSTSKLAYFLLVPYWARCLAEVLTSSGVAPKDGLVRAKRDDAFRGGVRAALSLGGYIGLRDFLRSEKLIP